MFSNIGLTAPLSHILPLWSQLCQPLAYKHNYTAACHCYVALKVHLFSPLPLSSFLCFLLTQLSCSTSYCWQSLYSWLVRLNDQVIAWRLLYFLPFVVITNYWEKITDNMGITRHHIHTWSVHRNKFWKVKNPAESKRIISKVTDGGSQSQNLSFGHSWPHAEP